MKKRINSIKKHLKINKKLFVFLFVIVLVGIISGTILSLMLNSSDEKLVVTYLQTFFNNLSNLNTKENLINVLFGTLGLSIIVYLLGLSVIGFIIIIFIIFWKSFVLGFSLSSIINIYNLKGVLYAFIYIFPHQLINLLLFILFSGMALVFSFKIITNLTKEKKFDLTGIKKYNNSLIIILITGCLTSLYEVLVMPNILSFILNILK